MATLLQAGDCVGYGASWSANQQTTIAIIAIGYGDGYPRHATNTTPVLINATQSPACNVLIETIGADSCIAGLSVK
jgi:alanine racemase